jgi:branched-subunit amino acid ABC-type transport system permease component
MAAGLRRRFGSALKALVCGGAGGIGSVTGRVPRRMALGGFETAWSMLMPIDAATSRSMLLVAVLVFEPSGCFSPRALTPRQVDRRRA